MNRATDGSTRRGSRQDRSPSEARPAPAAWEPPTFVVGIGASAGGLESLEAFFGAMPRRTGMAFVVIQHLSPDFDSMMDTLLARRTDIPIRPARDREPVAADTVYLLPPRKEMIVSDGRLLLTDKDRNEALTLPVDRFFRSLAQDQGEKGVAVVLSGSGSDGSRGVRDVKRAGGLVLAESGETARFEGMPGSARETGCVDHVLAPHEMPGLLVRYARGDVEEGREGDDEAADVGAPAEGVDRVLEILRADWNLDFSQYKPATVTRRIERRLSLSDVEDIDTYVALLRDDPVERSALYQDLLIGVTRFFRDAEAFQTLELEVVPELLRRVPAGEPIRGWVVGCATGEEAYSLAILFHEQLERMGRPIDVKLFATDVHRASLEFASAGIYPEERLADVSEARLRRYFLRKENGYQISGDLRQMVVFAPHDVTTDAPFTRLDLISCRNLLIYFQPSTQRKAISLFHFGLKTGGALLLGSSESPGDLADEFDPIDDAHRVYRKRRDVRLAPELHLPPTRRGRSSLSHGPGAASSLAPAPGRSEPAIPLDAYDALLDRYMPPSLLVNERRELVDSFGDANRFLQVRARRPSSDAIDMLRTDARVALTGSLRRVQEHPEALRLSGITVEDAEGPRRCDVTLEPFTTASGRHVLIGIHEHDATQAPAPRSVPSEIDLPQVTLERIQSLEVELGHTREDLQATIEELETSNEELQATNEELVASNEELQSTNEELHSVNEELYTVNNEYQKKMAELNVVNRDMNHLLAGIEVATIFLDADLCIRKLTPRVSELFDVMPQDVGRKLASFTHRLQIADLMDDLRFCLERDERVEREVRDVDGATWFLRILPYEADDRTEGVVLTLVDIEALAETRAELERISAIVESSGDAIIGKDLDGTITSWNAGAERLYGWTAEEALGRGIDFLLPPERKGEMRDILRRVREGETVHHVETQRICKDGGHIDVSVMISPVHDPQGELQGASDISRDISARKNAERLLRVSERNYQDLYQNAPDMYLAVDARSGEVLDCNRTTLRKLGYEREEIVGRAMLGLYLPGSRPTAEQARERLVAQGEVRDVGLQVVRRDGSILDVSLNATAVRDEEGEVVRMRAVWRDVTQRRRAESRLKEEIRRRERFLAMLSHELRNPMNALQTAAALLDADADEAAREHARAVIRRQLHHMGRLLDDLLDVARVTQDKIELRRERVDLRTVCEEAAATAGSDFTSRGVELRPRLADAPLVVDGDPARLQQVAINLLANAAKYSPPGGCVELACTRRGSSAVLRVTDHGVGIPEEMLERIFDPFLQVDASDGPGGGMGLGLTLVRSIVELHGGQVAAASDGRGRGSTFSVEIPLAGRAASAPPAAPDRAAPAHGLRVVVVEDLEDSRVSLETLLRRRGCEVWGAADAESGASAIANRRPDLALVDIGLPDAPGYEVARRVREEPTLRDTWLVALTGYGQQGDVERALEAGFDEHLVKPLDLERLDQLLAERAGVS